MKRLIILALVILAMLPSGCGRKPKRVVIGIALTASYHPAIQLAMQEINAGGGINGVPVELMGMDWKVVSHFEAGEILQRAASFTQEKDLIAVIGHSDSSSTLSAAAFYNQRKVPQIVTIATNPAITNIGSWTYRLCLSDAAQGPALAEYAVRDWGKRRIAVFYVNDDYGRGLAQMFERRVGELGAKIVSSVMHRNILASDDKELIHSTFANFKQSEKPDLVVLFQRIEAARWSLNTMREAGLKADVLGGDSISAADFANANATLMEGVRVSQFFLPQPDNALTMEFIRNFKAFQGIEPDYGHAFAYDAMYLVRDAAMKGAATREGVKAYLDNLIAKQIQGNGVVGTFTLGADHDARRALHIVETRNGSQILLKTLQVN